MSDALAALPLPLSDALPVAEAVAAAAGSGSMAARDSHVHQRLSSATTQTLDGTGSQTVTFTRSFSIAPAVMCLLIEAGANQPVIFKVSSWVMTGPLFTGCVIKGQRASILPALSGIILIGPLVSALSNMDVFGGSAAGASFCCIALQPSA